MAELPILPIATDAILADTTHMSPEEFGVYCRLLFVMWRQGAQLHDDDSELANIGGVPLKRWASIKEKVMRPMTIANGIVTQKKLTETWGKVQVLRVKRSSASNHRWQKRYNYHPKSMQMDNQMQSNSNAIPKPNKLTTTSCDTPNAKENGGSLDGGDLATAPNRGALRSPPVSEQDQGSGPTSEQPAKPPWQASRAEIEASFAKRRATN